MHLLGLLHGGMLVGTGPFIGSEISPSKYFCPIIKDADCTVFDIQSLACKAGFQSYMLW